jgi:GTP-binding protein
MAGAEVLGRRGEDLRIDQSDRRTNVQRREELAARRAYEAEKREARDEGRDPDWTFPEEDPDLTDDPTDGELSDEDPR